MNTYFSLRLFSTTSPSLITTFCSLVVSATRSTAASPDSADDVVVLVTCTTVVLPDGTDDAAVILIIGDAMLDVDEDCSFIGMVISFLSSADPCVADNNDAAIY